ncbi:MAG TPA: sensor histidine kinase [Humisphaera sp.]
MTQHAAPRTLGSPPVTWLIVVAVLFGTEYAIMLALSRVAPNGTPPLVEALVDAVAITAAVGPLIWLLLVRPLRQLLRVRSVLLGDVFQAMEVERRRVAGELHDGLGQSLSLLISGLRTAQGDVGSADVPRRLHDLERIAQAALADVRRMARGLRPSLLDDLGLAPALAKLAEDVAAHSGVRVAVDAAAAGGRRLPGAVETAVFRVVQEALANVVRHAGATAADVHVGRADGAVTVRVTDDGRGFDPAALSAGGRAGSHSGLIGMGQRAALLGGTFRVDAAPGRGCRVEATFPLRGSEDGQDEGDAR